MGSILPQGPGVVPRHWRRQVVAAAVCAECRVGEGKNAPVSYAVHCGRRLEASYRDLASLLAAPVADGGPAF